MIQTEKELTNELIVELIEQYRTEELPRLQKLQDYYDGLTDITKREMAEDKPNNKVVLNYPAYIVDMIVGYFVGIPVAYTSQDKELLDEIQDIFNLSDEQDQNHEIATMMGMKGIAYELLYADEEANVRFNELDPLTTFIVWDNKIIPEPRFGIRFYEVDETEFVEVYTEEDIYHYELDGDKLALIDEQAHFFGDVPIVSYINNKQRTADFEKVMTLIDAMEIANSNSINDLEYFSDAYMYLIGMMGTEPEDIAEMNKNRLLLLEEAGEAGFLTKPSNNKDSEDIKDRLNADIHKFARVPDLGDEEFSGNASGVAMAYKHFGLDQVVANKERKFKTGLNNRLRLICNFLNTKAGTDKYNYDKIKPNFSRNKPVNEKENAEIAQILMGMTSDQTALSYLTMVDDPLEEQERMELERDAYRPLDELVDADEEE